MRSTPGGLPYPRRLINSSESSTPGAFNTFVSNASAPQLVDYALVVGLGFFAASVISPQGQTSGAEYKHGTHALPTHAAEAAKTQVFPAATPVFGSTPRVIPITQGSPQLADLTLQAQFYKPSPASQGRVPPSLFGSQTDPTQLQGSIWSSQRTPVIVANPVASFFSIPQQQYVDSNAQVISPLVSGNTPRTIPLVSGSQVDPTQIAASVWQAIPNPPVLTGILGATILVPPQVQFTDRPVKQVFPSLLAGQTTPVISQVFGSPQADPTQIPSQVWASIAPPPLTSGILAPFYFVPSQFDVSLNGTVVWTQSTFSPSAVVIQQGGGGQLTRYRKTYHLRPKYLREAFEIRREEEFLATFQERIEELAGIVESPAETRQERKEQKAAEIKLLSNVNALAKSYSVELKSIESALRLIEQRMADMRNEEALAIILIAANT